MKRGRAKLTRKMTIARTRLTYDESKQDDPDLHDDEFINDAAQGLQRGDQTPPPSDKELETDIQRVLNPSNPQANHNYSYFSFKQRVYKKEENVEQMVVHFSMDGTLLLKDSEQANNQDEFVYFKRNESDNLLAASAVQEGFPTQLDHITQLKSLRNQFNYAERTSQTMTLAVKQRGVSTEPPPTRSFSGTVTQWDIYDNYVSELNLVPPPPVLEDKKERRKRGQSSNQSVAYTSEMSYAIKTMERMVNQNDLQYTYNAYKYVDSFSDQVITNEGSLNKLWTFVSEKTKKKQVTAISWNPNNHDLFAIGYGNYSFMKKTTGLICCYSLKNTRYPEYFFSTQQGVMCLDWHPQHPSLLAVGLYDGTVMVFDVRAKHKKALYQSNVRTNKHTDPVWQVKWQDDDPLRNLSFFSISSDGRVTNWVLMKNKLEPEEVIKLKLVSGQREGEEDETALSGLAGGTCFDFNPFFQHLFLVGTEEGKIHKCNKAYSGQYLETYEGHFMAVYTVKWNKFHPKIFLSCSADWTVKMWDHTVKTPLLTFDLGVAVGDIQWAPYSSSIFAAITADSKCHVYDIISVSQSEICDKKVMTGKLNHISFNPSQPIILIGNDKGSVESYKLSPNLRKSEVLTQEEIEAGVTKEQKETTKIENIVNSIDRTVY